MIEKKKNEIGILRKKKFPENSCFYFIFLIKIPGIFIPEILLSGKIPTPNIYSRFLYKMQKKAIYMNFTILKKYEQALRLGRFKLFQ